ncbi:MAG: hypothetical protein L6R39_001539 [Caloplaca ligustica]|nr:MAG: hypothetical protein L6R39_001539 [Caloplaca ligustica]
MEDRPLESVGPRMSSDSSTARSGRCVPRIVHGSGEEYKLRVVFKQTSHELIEDNTVMDLDPTVNFLDRPDESRTLLLEFLDQFEEIESRWQNVYDLILLALIAQALQPIAEFMTPVDEAGQEVKESLRTLCDLYLFCFGSLHPFAEPYDRAMYAVMVDNDRIAVRHFHILNSLWEQAGKTVL